VLYLWLGAKRLITQSYNSGKPSDIFLLGVTLASWGNSAYKKPSWQSSMAEMLSLRDALLRCSTRWRNGWRHHVPTRTRIFFGSQVTHFSGDPSQSSTGSYVLFFEEATCKSSTINRLLYAHEALIVAQRYDSPWDWLWDACHMAGVHWGSRCKGFCSKEGPHYRFMQNARNMTINLIHELEIPWGFHPGLYCVA
jgi:hypothetical protein